MIRSLLSSKFIQDIVALQAGKIGLVALSFISSLVVWRLMGPERMGDFALAQSFLIVWQTLDLTGVGTSTATRLAIAIGANDDSAILDLMAFYVKLSFALNIVLTLLIAVLGMPVASLLYDGNTRIAALAFWLAIGSVGDGLYGLVIIALQSRRSMRALALMQNANQLVLTICLITAVTINPTAENLVAGRLVYSYTTLALGFWVFSRLRSRGTVDYPSLGAIFARARTVSPRPYWRFGVANAIDRNLASLFVQLPLQLVGIFVGAHAVGYLNLALNGITQVSIFTSAVLDNMQVVVPQAIGRQDFVMLWRNFRRVVAAMGLVGLGLYGALALVAPVLIPPILGTRWIPAIPVLGALALYGAVTTVGGNFAPLYRAFALMRQAIVVKLIALAISLPIGIWLFSRIAVEQQALVPFVGLELLTAGDLARAGEGALAGAWMIDAVFVISVTLTALVTLPVLRRKARSAADRDDR